MARRESRFVIAGRVRRPLAGDRTHGLLTPVTATALGFATGVAVGALAWSRLVDVNRRGLFSRHPVRRFAAISYLGAQPSVDTVRLLQDYIEWEPHSLLRRRARRVLRGVEAALERFGP